MGSFKLGGMTFGSLFKKPETVLYPFEQKPAPVGLKGHIENDASACILCGICSQELPGRCHRGGEEGAHLGHRSVPLRAVRHLRARLSQALPDHGSRLHAHRHREILPRGARPRPKGGGDGIVSLTAR